MGQGKAVPSISPQYPGGEKYYSARAEVVPSSWEMSSQVTPRGRGAGSEWPSHLPVSAAGGPEKVHGWLCTVCMKMQQPLSPPREVAGGLNPDWPETLACGVGRLPPGSSHWATAEGTFPCCLHLPQLRGREGRGPGRGLASLRALSTQGKRQAIWACAQGSTVGLQGKAYRSLRRRS